MPLKFPQFGVFPNNCLLNSSLECQFISFRANPHQLSRGISVRNPALRQATLQSLTISLVLFFSLFHLSLQVHSTCLGNYALFTIFEKLSVQNFARRVQDFYFVGTLDRGLFDWKDGAVIVKGKLLDGGKCGMLSLNHFFLIQVNILLLFCYFFSQNLLEDIVLAGLFLFQCLKPVLMLNLLLFVQFEQRFCGGD